MTDIWQYSFFQDALIAGFLVSIACGVMGSLIVVNRLSSIAGGISHAAYGGIGLAVFLGCAPLLGVGIFCLLIALWMGFITCKDKQRSDTLVGVLWAFGMALGVVLIDLTPGYKADMMNYLFGNILTVTAIDLRLMAALCLIILSTVFFGYKHFLALSYDEQFAQVMHTRVVLLYMMLLILISLSIVILMQTVGLILLIALLTIPPYIAEKFSRSLKEMMVYSFILSSIFTFLGLWLSYLFNLTSGAMIILTASGAFFIQTLVQSLQPQIARLNRRK